MLGCDNCVACASPAVDPNTLFATKQPLNATFSWGTTGGAGDFNLHRTLDRTALPALYSDLASRIGTTGSLSLADTFDPLTVAYYKVYGRDSCSGASVGP